jgi:hypothetical protein
MFRRRTPFTPAVASPYYVSDAVTSQLVDEEKALLIAVQFHVYDATKIHQTIMKKAFFFDSRVSDMYPGLQSASFQRPYPGLPSASSNDYTPPEIPRA